MRELKNIIERAVLTGSGPVLELKDVLRHEGGMTPEIKESSTSPLSLKEMEKGLIFKALEKTNGNRTHAARILGISIRTLRNKLHEYQESASGLGI